MMRLGKCSTAVIALFVVVFSATTEAAPKKKPAPDSARNQPAPRLECRSADGYTFCCPSQSAWDCLTERINDEYMNGIEDHSAAFRACGCVRR
jgi:hypothetical protein